MKFPYRFAAIVFSLGLLTSGCAYAGVLINPGFETGDTTGWTLDFVDQFPEKWQIVASPVHEGSYALLAKNWPKSLSASFDPIQGSQVTEFSFWTKVTLDSSTVVLLLYSDDTSKRITLSSVAGDYAKVDVTLEIDPFKELMGFQIFTYVPSNPYAVDTYYDSFTLTVIPEGRSILLSLLGVGVILAFRYKETSGFISSP